MTLTECINRGLLKKTSPSMQQATASLVKAREFIKEAEEDSKENRVNSAVLVAYAGLLNASKALLYKDGWREKSHACVIEYLKEKYAPTQISKKEIELLEYYKNSRHAVQYDLDFFVTEKNCREMVEFSKNFLKTIEKLV